MKLQVTAILAIAVLIFACEHRTTEPTSDTGPSSSIAPGSANDSTPQPPATHGPVASVAVTRAPLPNNRDVVISDSLGFSADIRDAEGHQLFEKSATWTSSNTAVVRLDWSAGRFAIGRAVGAGTATVSAASDGKTGNVSVTVR